MLDDKILVCVDLSYFLYYTIFGAASDWESKEKEEASLILKPASETPQDCLPDLTKSSKFCQSLKTYVMKRLSTVSWILKDNFQEKLDSASCVDFLFLEDDKLSKNWRKKIYPEYKAQRKLIKKQYDVQKIKEYVQNVLFRELELENSLGFKLVFADSCEGDDLIALALTKLPGYSLKVLFASDKDFLQIDGVRQFTLAGREVIPEVQAKPSLPAEKLSSRDFLLYKILTGDKSDNIPNVFSGKGSASCLKLVRDRESLKALLKEDAQAARQFILNKSIIDFSAIPEEVSSFALAKISEKLKPASGSSQKILSESLKSDPAASIDCSSSIMNL